MMEETASRKAKSAEVPVIDMIHLGQEYEDEGSEQWKCVARQLYDAFTSFGGAYLTNHGLPEDQLNRVLTAGAEFFSLNEETKNCYLLQKPSSKGYLSTNAGDTFGDDPESHESFIFHMDEERYPDIEVPSFRPAASSFRKSCMGLCNKISTLLALALGKEMDSVVSKYQDIGTDNNISSFRMNYSPSAPSTGFAGNMRFGGHYDVTIYSLLFQDEARGFQMCDRDGTWLDVDPMQGAIFIFAGEFAKFFFDDEILPMKHRVVIPAEEPWKSMSRLSLGYFIHPDNHLMIPSKYIPSAKAPVIAKEYIYSMLAHFKNVEN